MHPNSTSCLRRHVLYVEDQPVNAMLMRALFERVPQCDLVVAECARHALDVAVDLHPSLLLLDQRLPDLRGSELLPLLRRVPGCEMVPAIVVTAEHEFDISSTGFVEVWRKPLHLHKVLERLHWFLAHAVAPSRVLQPPIELARRTAPAVMTPQADRA
jgi:CheY-like chemotaxis protein